MSLDLAAVLGKNRIIPIAQFDDPRAALRTAELLAEHSFGILEITLRTDAAFDCIAGVRREFPGLSVGAGSILTLESFKKAVDAGASFCVAPGTDMEIVDYANSRSIPFIPGVATPTEINAALAKCPVVKLFPAVQLGGIEYIMAVTAPFKTKNFHLVPTGGINRDNYRDYLRQDRVIAVGMSYPVDSALVRKGDFAALGERMKDIMSGLR